MKKPGYLIFILAVLMIVAGASFAFRSRGGADKQTDRASAFLVATTSLSGQTYSDPDLHFSFAYPEGFTALPSGDPSARLILVSSSLRQQEFQLYVTPFGDDPASVTAVRIRRDVPDIDMRDAKMISVPGGGQGASFLSSRSGVVGDVREIWFALKGHLYQWSAPIGSEPLMQTAISTLITS